MGEFGKPRSDGKHRLSKSENSFHKTSAAGIQKEIANVRKNVGSLREFLRGCQDTINAETAKLEKQCLGKIKSLEDERSHLQRKLESAVEENGIMNKSLAESSVAMLQSENAAQNSRSEITHLRAKVVGLESSLKVKSEQCDSLLKETEKSRLRCLELENKLAASSAYVQEQKEVFKEMLSDQKQLQCNNSDLKMQFAESEAYEKALQEHVIELEGICAILRDQLDEQQKYFLQKEMTIRKEGSERYGIVLGEKKTLSNNLAQLRLQLDAIRDELENEATLRKQLENLNHDQGKKCINLEKSLEDLKSQLALEKSTVAMLTQKNNELSIKLVQGQSELRHLQDKLGDQLMKNDDTLNRKAMKEVQNTIQRYFDGQKKADCIIERELMSSTNTKLAEVEKLLSDERKLRLSAEIQVENLHNELKKAESAVRNHKGNGSKARRQPHKKQYGNDGSDAQNNKITQDSYSSESAHKDDTRVGDNHASQLHGMSDEQTSEQNACNTQLLPSFNHSVPHIDLSAIRGDSMSIVSDVESLTSVCDDFMVSPRASQRLAEANKKALMLLHGMKNP